MSNPTTRGKTCHLREEGAQGAGTSRSARALRSCCSLLVYLRTLSLRGNDTIPKTLSSHSTTASITTTGIRVRRYRLRQENPGESMLWVIETSCIRNINNNRLSRRCLGKILAMTVRLRHLLGRVFSAFRAR